MEAQKTPADEKFKFIFPPLVVFALFSRFIVTESCKFNAQFLPVVWVVLTLYIKEMAAKLNFYYVCTPKKRKEKQAGKIQHHHGDRNMENSILAVCFRWSDVEWNFLLAPAISRSLPLSLSWFHWKSNWVL